MRIVVAGGGPAGLLAASLLSEGGAEVLLVDPSLKSWPKTPADVGGWHRPGLPQLWHAHALHALGRGVLERSSPGALNWLLESGATPLDFSDFIPRSQQREDDRGMVALLLRRPLLDLALLHAAQQSRLRRVTGGVGLVGIELSPRNRVSAARLSNGESIACDMIVDAMGRRSPTSQWLAPRFLGADRTTDSSTRTYLCQHFRLVASENLPVGTNPFGPAGEAAGTRVSVLREDGKHFALTINLPRASRRAISFHQDLGAWRTVVNRLPDVAQWIDVDIAEPVGTTQLVVGPPNSIVDTSRWPPGLLAIGDALATTNPTHGWGLSLALAHAEILSRSLSESWDDVEVASAMTRCRLLARSRAAVLVAQQEAKERVDPALRQLAATDPASPTYIRRNVYARAMEDPEALRLMVRRTQYLEFDDELETTI